MSEEQKYLFSGIQWFREPRSLVHFCALLMGQAASRTGLAKRVGVLVLHKVGTSYGRLLLGLITLMFGLSFVITSANAQVATLAPLVVGIIAALGLAPHSNVAKGLFVALTYTSTIFSRMFISITRAFWSRASSWSRRASGCCGVNGSWPSCRSPFSPLALAGSSFASFTLLNTANFPAASGICTRLCAR